MCSLSHVQQVCKEIQQKHGSEGKLRYMGRLRGFIEAMEQLGKVIEVFVNASEFVCFIWVSNCGHFNKPFNSAISNLQRGLSNSFFW